jgi:hypothetical protein
MPLKLSSSSAVVMVSFPECKTIGQRPALCASASQHLAAPFAKLNGWRLKKGDLQKRCCDETALGANVTFLHGRHKLKIIYARPFISGRHLKLRRTRPMS